MIQANDKHRKIAILQHVWTLTDSEMGWLDSYFLLRTNKEALEHHTIRNRIVYKDQVYDLIYLYPDRTISSLLLSLRVSRHLRIACALVLPAPANLSEKILTSTSEFPE